MLTVKKTTRTMKSLEGSLLMNRNGERTTFSHKTAKLDELIPKHLGVSAAVLDNVIFCHQEDSLWPMSAPAVLKKKFDEIFDALKYTKAIDNLKSMKKDHSVELTRLKIQEANAKVNKDKGERLEERARLLSKEIDDLGVKEKKLIDEAKDAAAKVMEKREQAEQALGVVNELKKNRDQAEFTQGLVNEQLGRLTEIDETEEWLVSTLREYEKRMLEYEKQKDELKMQYAELQQAQRNSREQSSEKQAEKGQLQAQKENYEDKLQLRAQLVREEARRHGIRGQDGDLEDNEIQEFIKKLRKLYQDKDRELERIKKSTDDELRQARDVVTDLDSRRTIRTQERLNARLAITENDKKAKKFQVDVDDLNMDEGGKAAIEESLKDVRKKFRQAEADYATAKWDQNLSMENNRLSELERESERLRLELVQCNKLASDRAQLEYVKKEVKGKKTSLDTMLSTHRAKLNAVLGPDWEVASLEREFQAAVDQRTRAFTDAQKQQDGTNSELQHIEFKLKTIRESLKKKLQDKSNCESTVLSSITRADGEVLGGLDEYESELATLEDERNSIQKDIDGFKYVTDYYAKCLTIVNDKNKCRLCDRKFADQKERSAALDRINAQLAKDARSELEKELRKIEADYQKAVVARPQFENFKSLTQKDIPGLEKELRDAERKRDGLLHVLSQHDSLVAQEGSAKTDVEALTKTVEKITGYASDISDGESRIVEYSSQRKLQGSSLTIDELNEQSTTCAEQIQTIKSKVARMSSDNELAKSTLNSLGKEETTILSRLNDARHLLDKKNTLLAQLGAIRENNVQQRENMKRADAELEALVPQFSKANAQYDDIKQRGRGKEREIQTDKDRLADSVNKLDQVEGDINKYIGNGGAQKLAACERAIKALQQDQKDIDNEVAQITKKANEVALLLSDSDRSKRNIEDNISYRKYLRDLEEYRQTIADLESRNVTDDHQRLAQEAFKWQKREQNLLNERGAIVGQIGEKDNQLTHYLEEWETDYKDAAHEYRETHIKVETTKAAIEDLGSCGKALEGAIMQFHTLKMEEINRIAGELWQSTYQGTDVDTIMIKAENETASTSGVKRSYNYRVVMVKQDVEMDMRGRCSAGQKVLASIIIRMALAECFGVNCGVSICPTVDCVRKVLTIMKVIALDEPTTNLDRDTIRSLAESLHTIIKTRKAQANFQLIVITHDEEFLREMKCSDFTDTYWHVSRNDKQKSIITEQEISLVMG